MMFFALRWFHIIFVIVMTDASHTKGFHFWSYDEYANWCTPGCCPQGDCYSPCADYGVCKEGLVTLLITEKVFP